MKRHNIIYLSFLLILFISCSDELKVGGNEIPYTGEGIIVSAYLEGEMETRGEGTPITSGTYRILYPYNSGYISSVFKIFHNNANVNFGNAGYEGIGIPYYKDNDGELKDLTWGGSNGINIYTTYSGARMFMDNYPKDALDSLKRIDTDPVLIPLFQAGVYDDENFSNDPVWGTGYLPKNETSVEFQLKHLNSRLQVVIIVDKTENGSREIDLKDANLRLTNIIKTPYQYNRTKGEIILPTADSSYEVFMMVDEKNNTETQQLYWKEITEDDKTITYKSEDFVFPPQILKTGADRPRLILKVPKSNGEDTDIEYTEYSNYLPPYLNVLDSDGNPTNISDKLNFFSGYKLTLTSHLSPEELNLVFQPVTVEKWVRKDGSTFNVNQASIRYPSDFDELIEIYKSNDLTKLSKFGYQDTTGKWVFQFWNAYVKLELEKILGSMVPGNGKPEYTFDFLGREEWVLMPDGNTYVLSGATGQNELYQILSSTTGGVKKVEDFYDLIKVYQSDSWKKILYGEYNKRNSEWNFQIKGNLTLDYDLIAGSMINGLNTKEKPYSFSTENATVNISGSPNETEITLDRLKDILNSREKGIYLPDDFYKICAAYNSQDNTILNKYGDLVDNKFNFYIRRDITLKENEIQGRMQGDGYDFTPIANHQINLIRFDQGLREPFDLNDIKKILNLQILTGINTREEFAELVRLYNEGSVETRERDLSKYGYLNRLNDPERWIFVFNNSVNLELNEISGSMVYNNQKGFYYGFEIGTNIVNIYDSDVIIYSLTSTGSLTLYYITFK